MTTTSSTPASSSKPKPAVRASGAPTLTTMLLYWLLILCGLEGLTILRMHAGGSSGLDFALAPLWLGTIAGVAVGQLVAWLRVRAWVPAVLAFFAMWLLPLAFFLLYELFGTGADTCVLAFFPAAICGYLSLSERGALVSFWYPAVLWMVVILDRGDAGGAGGFDGRATLPFVIGLAALFVAFLRARETRRVAIWRAHGSVRIAPLLARSVLRKSPIRAASQHAWTLLVGAAALVLTAWIAPQLWQKDDVRSTRAVAAAAAANAQRQQTAVGTASDVSEELPCCPDREAEARNKRVREYFPLMHNQEREHLQDPSSASCTVCRNGRPVASSEANDGYHATGVGPHGSGNGGSGTGIGSGAGIGTGGGGDGCYGDSCYYGGSPRPPPPEPTTDVDPLSPYSSPHTPTPPVVPTAAAAATTPKKPTTPTVTTGISSTPASTLPIEPAGPPISRRSDSPWKFALTFAGLCLGLHLVVRALRRHVTLRHLRRPFWAETLDQRISNHWQRVLIGLGDAGIHPTPNEQPHALARRVGITGMDTCATILERVRHGVRVDESDLATMDTAASTIYRTARDKAGVTGRATAWLRWPLAD